MVCHWRKCLSLLGVILKEYFMIHMCHPRYTSRTPHHASSTQEFVARPLEERLRNGSIELLHRWDEVDWPSCVMPLTVVSSKPRMCHDERFLNLFIKDLPFKLDTLRDVPRLVDQHSMLITTDGKSGYDQVKLAFEDRHYFGLMYNGWVMTYTTLPFGFKGSCFVYHSLGKCVSSFIRGKGIPTLGYKDDRLYDVGPGQEVLSEGRTVFRPSVENWEKVVWIVYLLTSLGYTLSLQKCCFTPDVKTRFLGMMLDTSRQAFFLPEDKRLKFKVLMQEILQETEVDLKTLQHFAGKCSSMAMAVPHFSTLEK